MQCSSSVVAVSVSMQYQSVSVAPYRTDEISRHKHWHLIRDKIFSGLLSFTVWLLAETPMAYSLRKARAAAKKIISDGTCTASVSVRYRYRSVSPAKSVLMKSPAPKTKPGGFGQALTGVSSRFPTKTHKTFSAYGPVPLRLAASAL